MTRDRITLKESTTRKFAQFKKLSTLSKQGTSLSTPRMRLESHLPGWQKWGALVLPHPSLAKLLASPQWPMCHVLLPPSLTGL